MFACLYVHHVSSDAYEEHKKSNVPLNTGVIEYFWTAKCGFWEAEPGTLGVQ